MMSTDHVVGDMSKIESALGTLNEDDIVDYVLLDEIKEYKFQVLRT